LLGLRLPALQRILQRFDSFSETTDLTIAECCRQLGVYGKLAQRATEIQCAALQAENDVLDLPAARGMMDNNSGAELSLEEMKKQLLSALEDVEKEERRVAGLEEPSVMDLPGAQAALPYEHGQPAALPPPEMNFPGGPLHPSFTKH
jgi:hypothetical protein